MNYKKKILRKQILFPYIRLASGSRGFSLLEILIAIVILAGTLSIILPGINRKQNEIKKNFRSLISINRTLYSYSRIYSQPYRLVFFIDIQKSSYWVEKKINQSSLRQVSDSESESDKKDKPHPFFEKDESILEEARALPLDMYFDWPEDVEPSTDKLMYIYYDPHSFSPPRSLLLKRGSHTWILDFQTLRGTLKITEQKDGLDVPQDI